MTHYVYWLRGAEFCDLARLSMMSVRRVDPSAHFHVWTDDRANTPRIDAQDVSWHELPSGRPAMVANLDAQIAALNYLHLGDQVLFLDADVVMRQRFPWALTPDLYVTWRHEVNGDRDMALLQPYNYGVIGAHVRPQVVEAFYWLRARILQMTSRNQNWYGNQLALAELIGAAPAEEAGREIRVHWAPADRGTPLEARLLPCATWNFSPDSADDDVSSRGILHMKGGRKDLMKHFAEAA